MEVDLAYYDKKTHKITTTSGVTSCACGHITDPGESVITYESHNFELMVCTECGYNHTHEYSNNQDTTCNICGDTRDVLTPLPTPSCEHPSEKWIKEVTGKKYEVIDGNYNNHIVVYTAKITCKCGEVIDYNYVSEYEQPHSYSGGVCDYCGMTEEQHNHEFSHYSEESFIKCEESENESKHIRITSKDKICTYGCIMESGIITRYNEEHEGYEPGPIKYEYIEHLYGPITLNYGEETYSGDEVHWVYTVEYMICICGKEVEVDRYTDKVEQHHWSEGKCIDCGRVQKISTTETKDIVEDDLTKYNYTAGTPDGLVDINESIFPLAPEIPNSEIESCDLEVQSNLIKGDDSESISFVDKISEFFDKVISFFIGLFKTNE